MYEVSGASMDRGVVVLNDIHIDIVDYIQPALCTDADFRQMWAEFEWENKVTQTHLQIYLRSKMSYKCESLYAFYLVTLKLLDRFDEISYGSTLDTLD